MTAVRRLNHAVLYVRDARTSSAFYQQAFEFEVIGEFGDGAAVFMRVEHRESSRPGSVHDRRAGAGPERGRAGLYHLAWEVDTIQDLATMRERLMGLNALVGESDHGVSKSLYGHDPDGIEFEVMWTVPREAWGALEHEAVTERLDLHAELARWG